MSAAVQPVVTQGTKRCRVCRAYKPLAEFNRNPTGRNPEYRRSECRACQTSLERRREAAARIRKRIAKGKRVTAIEHELDPRVLLYRAEKKRAAPRLAKRAKTIEAQCRKILEAMTWTAGGFHVPSRSVELVPATDKIW